MRKIKNFIWLILRKINLGGVVQLILKSALLEDGWFNSFNKKESIDKLGNPIPWNTYPYIKFIEPRLKDTFQLFEFGSGNSTIWYAEKVRSIKSVENDEGWFKVISNKLPKNAQVVHHELSYDGNYAKEVEKDNIKYNMIIVDGRDRVNTIKYSIQQLSEDGVIIFDNSNLPQYSKAIELLSKQNFKRIDFIGISPITAHNNYTTIFYKRNNCLGI